MGEQGAECSKITRVREELYENQRWYNIKIFRSRLLSPQRSRFLHEDGTEYRAKEQLELPTAEWIWEGDWKIDKDFNGEMLEKGWTYAEDFGQTFSAEIRPNAAVRRRKWYRVRILNKSLDSNVQFIRNIHYKFHDLQSPDSQTSSHTLKENIHFTCRNLIQLKNTLPSGNSVVGDIQKAILSGARDWFDNIKMIIFNSITECETESKTIMELEALIKLGRSLNTDLKAGLELLDPPLKMALQINFFEITYQVYDDKYGELVEFFLKFMKRSDSKLLQLEFKHDTEGTKIKKNISKRQSLLQLYLVVKKFAVLSSNLSSTQDLKTRFRFHIWFLPYVSTWLDKACYQVTQDIPKAVEKDIDSPNIIESEDIQLPQSPTSRVEPLWIFTAGEAFTRLWKKRPSDVQLPFTLLEIVGDNVASQQYGFKVSSSAFDTSCIIQQIYLESFWDLINWPDVEEEFTFTCKILEDLRCCFTLYAELVCSKFEDQVTKNRQTKTALQEVEHDIFNELCKVVRNLQYLVEESKSIIEKLRISIILKKMEEKGLTTANQCRQSVTILTDSVTDYLQNQITNALNEIDKRMKPAIIFLMPEIVKDINTNNNSSNTDKEERKLMDYLDKNLCILKQNLPPKQFIKAHSAIWETTEAALITFTRSCIEKQQRVEVFQRIQNHYGMLYTLFFPPDEVEGVYKPTKEIILRNDATKDLLQLHGTFTAELILNYSRERFKHQLDVKKMEENGDHIINDLYGFITVCTAYWTDTEEVLIEILNCRRLKMHRDFEAKCFPYVRGCILTKEVTTSKTMKFVTKFKKDTTCPLFDELFSIKLTPQQLLDDGLISLRVFNYDHVIGKDELLGEAFVPLKSIHSCKSNASKKLEKLPQQHFPLTLPKPAENDRILETLKNRLWDRSAVKFVKDEMLKPH